MYQFDRLGEVRSIARARAVEDYEYFTTHVLGHRTLSELSREIWEKVVHGRVVTERVSETFTWLFPELDASRSERVA